MQLRRRAPRPSTVVTLRAVGLHREHQAGAHRLAVQQHGAGAADAVLAADVRAGRARARRAGSRRASCAARPPPRRRSPFTVMRTRARWPGSPPLITPSGRASSPRRARAASAPGRGARRYSAEAWTSESGSSRSVARLRAARSKTAVRRLLPDQQLLRAARPNRRRSDAEQHDPRACAAAACSDGERRHHAGEREIAVSARDLQDRPARARRPASESAPRSGPRPARGRW